MQLLEVSGAVRHIYIYIYIYIYVCVIRRLKVNKETKTNKIDALRKSQKESCLRI